MKKAPFLLRRCSLLGCERIAAFLLDDGRTICDKHGFLFMIGDERVQKENEKHEAEHRKSLPDWDRSGPLPQCNHEFRLIDLSIGEACIHCGAKKQ